MTFDARQFKKALFVLTVTQGSYVGWSMQFEHYSNKADYYVYSAILETNFNSLIRLAINETAKSITFWGNTTFASAVLVDIYVAN